MHVVMPQCSGMFTAGLVLKLLREARQLKQEAVADAAPRNDKGEPMSPVTVSKAENDQFSPDTLQRILSALEVDEASFRNLIDRLNAAWTSPVLDVRKDLEDAAFWRNYTGLDGEWRRIAREMVESVHRMRDDAIDRRRRRQPP